MPASPSVQPPASLKPALGEPRRGFFAKAAAVVLGGLVVVCPFLAGLTAFLDPLNRKVARGAYMRVTPFDALADDGTPRRFPVIAARRDAWNKYPPEPVGAVFMRRVKTAERVEVFNVICPHLGCSVSFNGPRDIFQCPCHTSAFELDGAVISGPSPRGLDTLEFEIRDANGVEEVWVRFENFYTGRADKEPKE
jgi:menaquinol-cytochrome c reductase iron-sulfur subunit